MVCPLRLAADTAQPTASLLAYGGCPFIRSTEDRYVAEIVTQIKGIERFIHSDAESCKNAKLQAVAFQASDFVQQSPSKVQGQSEVAGIGVLRTFLQNLSTCINLLGSDPGREYLERSLIKIGAIVANLHPSTQAAGEAMAAGSDLVAVLAKNIFKGPDSVQANLNDLEVDHGICFALGAYSRLRGCEPHTLPYPFSGLPPFKGGRQSNLARYFFGPPGDVSKSSIREFTTVIKPLQDFPGSSEDILKSESRRINGYLKRMEVALDKLLDLGQPKPKLREHLMEIATTIINHRAKEMAAANTESPSPDNSKVEGRKTSFGKREAVKSDLPQAQRLLTFLKADEDLKKLDPNSPQFDAKALEVLNALRGEKVPKNKTQSPLDIDNLILEYCKISYPTLVPEITNFYKVEKVDSAYHTLLSQWFDIEDDFAISRDREVNNRVVGQENGGATSRSVKAMKEKFQPLLLDRLEGYARSYAEEDKGIVEGRKPGTPYYVGKLTRKTGKWLAAKLAKIAFREPVDPKLKQSRMDFWNDLLLDYSNACGRTIPLIPEMKDHEAYKRYVRACEIFSCRDGSGIPLLGSTEFPDNEEKRREVQCNRWVNLDESTIPQLFQNFIEYGDVCGKDNNRPRDTFLVRLRGGSNEYH
jgi:hypothetical protein